MNRNIPLGTTFSLCIVASFLGGAIVYFLSAQMSGPAVASSRKSLEVRNFERTPEAKMRENQIARSGAANVKHLPTAHSTAHSASTFASSTVPSQDLKFTEEELVNIAVYKKVNKSVVNITTKTIERNAFFMRDSAVQGSGSGSVIDRDGRILTNYHVIGGADFVAVTLFNGKMYEANVVGADPQNDIAVLKIDAPKDVLFPTTMGNSTGLQVGQKIYAIGNPFGLDRTLTTGIVSSLNRTIPGRKKNVLMKGIIQIDAALNQGNSGGPLINTRGEIIGMNTAIANPSQTGENTGVGFAIPANTISRVVPQLIEFGKVIRASLGIDLTWDSPEGLAIATVSAGGAAEKAGLQGIRLVVRRFRQGGITYNVRQRDFDNADRIVAVDSFKIRDYDDLNSAIEDKKPGEKVTVRILRGGKLMDVEVTLGED